MMVRRAGVGDDLQSPFNFATSDLPGLLSGFFQQQYGPLPLWAWTGGAFLLWWWLFMPSGSEYRKKRSALRSEYSGVSKLKRRGRRAKSGLKQVVT